MSYDYHIVLGIIAPIVGFFGLFPYIRDIFRGTTKPHPFTWFVWGLVNVVAFFAQAAEGGGAGTWLTAMTAFGCLTIAALSIARGEKRIVVLDWWCFAGALLGIVLWRLTDNPLAAILLVTLTDALASVPTFRKGYLRPHEETALSYVIGTVAYVLGLIALESFNPTTALYPAFIALTNIALVTMLLLRRRQLARIA